MDEIGYMLVPHKSPSPPPGAERVWVRWGEATGSEQRRDPTHLPSKRAERAQ